MHISTETPLAMSTPDWTPPLFCMIIEVIDIVYKYTIPFFFTRPFVTAFARQDQSGRELPYQHSTILTFALGAAPPPLLDCFFLSCCGASTRGVFGLRFYAHYTEICALLENDTRDVPGACLPCL